MPFAYPSNFSGTRWRVIDGDIYVSHLGSNVSGNGSPRKPYKTIQQAVNVAATGAKIIVGTGSYNEAVNGQGKSCRLTVDGAVLMNGTPSTAAFTNMGINSSIRGFSISGYQSAVSGAVKEVAQCFIRCPLSSFSGTISQTVLINTTLAGSAPIRLINCTLAGVSATSPTAVTYLESCNFGNTTSLQLSTPALTYFDYCNQEPGSVTQINGVALNTAAAVNGAHAGFQQHGLSVASQFNRTATGDYTLAPASALKAAGRRKAPMGALGEAISMSTEQILFGGSISAVTINSGNFFELPPGIQTGVIETPVIDLVSIRPVRAVRVYADQVFDEATFKIVSADEAVLLPGAITFEIRYADDPAGIAGATYQPMIWDKAISHDHTFGGNGKLSFDLRNSTFISTRCMQLRITLRNAGDIVLLAQENNDLLLQEDERGIQVE